MLTGSVSIILTGLGSSRTLSKSWEMDVIRSTRPMMGFSAALTLATMRVMADRGVVKRIVKWSKEYEYEDRL